MNSNDKTLTYACIMNVLQILKFLWGKVTFVKRKMMNTHKWTNTNVGWVLKINGFQQKRIVFFWLLDPQKNIDWKMNMEYVFWSLIESKLHKFQVLALITNYINWQLVWDWIPVVPDATW